MTQPSDNFPLLPVPGAQGIFHIFARSPGTGGDSWCHLIPGTERALLLDTAFGIGDLKGLVETLTKLPLTVVNSHNHGDHTLGNPQFETVYIHTLDAPQLYRQMEAPKRTLPEELTYHYTLDDLVQPAPYLVETVEDGHIFDLGGGYELEVFHLPGHSEGGIALLNRKRRMLFSGDALVWTPTFCMAWPGAPVKPYMTVEKFRDGLLRLMEHIDEFDVIYPGHSRLGISSQLVPDMLACCEELLEQGGYEEIVLATGANPIIPRIEGIDGENVCLANEGLQFEKTFSGKNVLVLGAGLVGVETAEVLTEYQNRVTVVDMLDRAAWGSLTGSIAMRRTTI